MTRLKWGMIGGGEGSQIGPVHRICSALDARFDMKAGALDADPARGKDFAERLGIASDRAYGDWREMLAGEKDRPDRVDLVTVATPNATHYEITKAFLEAGIHVLCEKPLEISVEKARAIQAAEKRSSAKLMTAYRLHFEPGTLAAIEKIRNGELGELVAFTSCFGQKLDPDNHRAKHGLEAGPLFDMAPYPINAIRYLFGAEPVAVESAVATRQPSAGLGDLDDTFAVVLRMPGDRLASFTVSYAMNNVDSLIIAGMKGSIHMSPAYGFQSGIEHEVTIGDKESHETFKHTDQFGGEMRYFSDCILNDRDPEPDAEEGMSDLRVIEGIVKAMETKSRVELPPFTRTRRIDPPSQRQTLSAVSAPEPVKAKSPTGS